MTAPLVRTDRLVLRAWRESDRAPFARMNADPAVMEYFPSTLSEDESDRLVDRIVAHWSDHALGLWAVEIPGEMAFAGFVGLSVPTFEAHFTPCVEIGWRLDPAVWGRGIATEAARAALRFGFVDHGVDEIVSFTTVANTRSRAVMERLGMTHDPADDFDHPRTPGWSGQRHVLSRLLADRWRHYGASS